MRITSLALTDLRRYRDREFELSPGLNIVRGPNEAGKSTIQRAIELGADAQGHELGRATSTGWCRGTATPTSRTTIAHDVHATRTRRASRARAGWRSRSAAPRAQVRLELGGDPITDPARADEELAAISGVPTEGFFRSTASVRHHELAGLQRDEGALRDRLQASISGADRGTSRAKRKLERALHDLQTRGVKNPGRLKVAEDAVTESASAAPGRRGRARSASSTTATRWPVAREHRAEAETALAERRSMLEKARQAERLTAERDAAQEKYDRYRTAVTIRDEIADLERNAPLADAAARCSAPRSTGCAPSTRRSRTLQGMLEGEVQVNFEVAARGPLAPALALVAGAGR